MSRSICRKLPGLLFCLLWGYCAPALYAQTTTFTYQGRLVVAGNPANGNYDLQFKLFDTLNVGTGTQQGATLIRTPVLVSAGAFSVMLDFGANVFDGAARYLEIGVRPQGSADPYTLLNPRQPITSTPYAIRSLTAGNAIQLGGVDAARYVQQDASSNVSIGGNLTVAGDGTYNTVNSVTAYNLNGQRILAANPANSSLTLGLFTGNTVANFNTFLGTGAGNANPTGTSNVFVGDSAGLKTTTGSGNSFLGSSAGAENTSGTGNSVFGHLAGQLNTTGSNNSFFGRYAGQNNTASGNSFFGFEAGLNNTTGANTFIGHQAGRANTKGSGNTFVGRNAGLVTNGDVAGSATGSFNSFFGEAAGQGNTTGSANTFFGYEAGMANAAGLFNSFFGHRAGLQNTANYNAFFGGAAGTQNTTGDENSFFGVQAGESNTTGQQSAFFGRGAGIRNTSGCCNAFFGAYSGLSNTTGRGNTFLGQNIGNTNVTGNNLTIVGRSADVGADGLNFASALGANAVVSASDTIVLGKVAGTYGGVARPADTVQIPGNLNITGNLTGGNLVKNLNGLTGNITLAAGANITITPAGNTLTIAATGGGGGSAILNQTTLQPGANFNIDGTGTANIFNATTQYDLQGQRFIASSVKGDATLVGFFAGPQSTGAYNVFVGRQAGLSNLAGGENAFIGTYSGKDNVNGNQNVFLGNNTGLINQSGNSNTFVGWAAGASNTTESENTLIGYQSNGAGGITNASTLGARAAVTQSNSLVLGSINGVNGATADTSVGIGTTAPRAKLDVTGGSILVGSPGQGIILKSTNGATCRLFAIDNAGAIVLTTVACP